MPKVLHLNKQDNVVNALERINSGDMIKVNGENIEVKSDIPQGHKIAIKAISIKEPIIKYGHSIGFATENIEIGSYVHVHNVKDPVSNWKKKYSFSKKGEKKEWNTRDIQEKMEQ